MIVRIDKMFCWFVFLLFLITAFPLIVISEGHSEEQTRVNLPIIMYHHATTDKKFVGKYTVLASEFEQDMEYITNKGYTCVNTDDLYNFINGNSTLPEKAIMITFDDGFESFYELCLPVLKKYNIKVVLSVIGIQCERYSNISDHNINYSNLNWEAVKQLAQSGYVEIGSHTYNLHHNEKGERKGMSILHNESEETYKKLIGDDINKMQLLMKQRAGITAKTIAYPYGAFNNLTTELVKSKGFVCSLTCEEKINIITKNAGDLYNLGRYNRPSGISSDEFFSPIIKEAESL